MEDLMQEIEELKTLADLRAVLKKWDASKFDKNNVNKKSMIYFLQGFRIIVRVYQEEEAEIYDKSTEKLALDWMQLYLNIQLLVSTSEVHLYWFSKSVPIAITYIIGCMINASNVSPNFYTEFLSMASQLLLLSHKKALSKLNIYARDLIPPLWSVVDKVGSFNTQMMVIALIQKIMKYLDESAALQAVELFPNTTAALQQKLLTLMTFNKSDLRYKQLVRKILNQYNVMFGRDNLVQTFSCKSFEIGDQLTFSKGENDSRFWIYFNSSPNTLTFHALLSTKSGAVTESVDVSLNIKTISCNQERLIIKFEPPADISVKTKINLKTINEAFAVLTEKEMKRFVETFKGNPKFRQNYEQCKSDDKSLPKLRTSEPLPPVASECDETTFKKPSLKWFESAVGKAKPQTIDAEVVNKTSLANRLESIKEEEPLLEKTKESESAGRFLEAPKQSLSSKKVDFWPTSHNKDLAQSSNCQRLNPPAVSHKESSTEKGQISTQTKDNSSAQQPKLENPKQPFSSGAAQQPKFENPKQPFSSGNYPAARDFDLNKEEDPILIPTVESASPKRFFKNPRQSRSFPKISYGPSGQDGDFKLSFSSQGSVDSTAIPAEESDTKPNSLLPQTGTCAEKRRFFKTPRQPIKVQIPWITQPVRKRLIANQCKKQVQKVQPVAKVTEAANKRKSETNQENMPLEASQVKMKRFNVQESFESFYDGPSTSRDAELRQKLLGKENTPPTMDRNGFLKIDAKTGINATLDAIPSGLETKLRLRAAFNSPTIKPEFPNRKRSSDEEKRVKCVHKDADFDSADEVDYDQRKKRKRLVKKSHRPPRSLKDSDSESNEEDVQRRYESRNSIKHE